MRVVAVAAVLALVGCANSFDAELKRLEEAEKRPHPLEINASEVSARTLREDDPHRNVITVEAPYIGKENFNSDLAGYRLKARKTKQSRSNFEVWLVVVTGATSWMDFTHAHSFGKSLPVETSIGTVGSCGQISCKVFETATVTIPLVDLERSLSIGGFELLLSGGGGKLKMNVPAPYIQGFLKKIKEEK